MTLQLLWYEYKEVHPEDGYQYSQFCELLPPGGQLNVVMRQEHRAGEKASSTFPARRFDIVDRRNRGGERSPDLRGDAGGEQLHLRRGELKAETADWIATHVRAFEFLGGARARCP